MIVGTGLFTSVGAATAKAGSGVLIAMLIGGLIALSTGISAAQVGVKYPEAVNKRSALGPDIDSESHHFRG